MKTVNVLAVDYGAGGGKAVLASFDGDRLAFEEVCRIESTPCRVLSGVYWNILGLFDGLKTAVGRAVKSRGAVAGLGIDAWATDFGVLDSQGNLLANPHSYLDDRTLALTDEVYGAYPPYELFRKTGIEPHFRFGLFQYLALKRFDRDVFDKAKTMLFIPNLLGYFCTGEHSCEATQASTTLLYDPLGRQWCPEIFDMFGLPNLFPALNSSASVLGPLTPAFREETGAGEIQVINIPQHDSAAAMLSSSVSNRDTVFISSGSWSIIGVYMDKPIVTRDVFEKKFNNQIGYGNRIMFVRNVLGLWILQQCVREWRREGYEVDYDELERTAESSGFDGWIDLDKDWMTVKGSICERIAGDCVERGLPAPKDRAQTYACVLGGLARMYRQVISDLSAITGLSFKRIHMVGGGARSAYLCGRTAAETGLEVVAGLDEGTSVGNAIAQLIALREIKDEGEAVGLVKNSFAIKQY